MSRRDPKIVIALVLFFGAAALYFVVQQSGSNGSSSASQEPKQKAVDQALVANLEAKVRQLEELEVFTGAKFDALPPKVYVGSTFYRISFEEKVAAVKILNDLINERIGNHGGGIRIDVHDARSGDRIYRWNYYKLER